MLWWLWPAEGPCLPILSVFLGWGGWVCVGCICVFFEYVLESRIRQWFIGRGHLGATEGPFAQRSAGWQTSSPFNLFNTGLSVKIPTNRVFVLFLSKMALLLIIPLHLQDSQAIHRIPQQLTCRSHTPASGASSPAWLAAVSPCKVVDEFRLSTSDLCLCDV